MHEAHIKMTYVSHISTFNYLNYLIIKYTYLTTKIKTIKTKKFTTDHHARDYIKKKPNLLHSFSQLRPKSLYPRNKPKALQLSPTYKMHKLNATY